MLETWDGKAINHGVALLLHERRQLNLGEPWAIAQLSLTSADYEKLIGWARQTSGTSLAALIARTDRMKLPAPAADLLPSIEGGVGLLLLALCSESVRREGSTYAVWPAVVNHLGSMPSAEPLITANGGATCALKSALHCAARQFGMLGGEFTDHRTNRWYRLLLLQGGIPDAELISVPRWLEMPQTTFLISDLRTASPEFAKAWDALGSYRRRTATRDAARRELAKCAFFRSTSTEAVLDAAIAERASQDHADETRQPLDVTLALNWEEGPPRVLLVANFGEASTLGRRVRLWINGDLRATYRKNSEGRFVRAAGNAIELALGERWLVTAEGSGDDPERLEVTAQLFENESDSNACFDSSGARCSAVAQSVRYVLAREPVEGKNIRRTEWFDGPGLSLTEVDSSSLVTTCHGTQLWPPRGVDPVDAEALGALRISGVVCGERVGELSLTLELPPSVAVKAARIGGGRFVVRASDANQVILDGVVPANAARPQLALTLTLEVGARLVQRTLSFRGFTAASLDGCWIDSTSTVEASRLRGGALRVTLGPEYAGHDALLHSLGNTTPLPDERACRVNVGGYGEPLEVHGQPPWNEGPSHPLVGTVTDHGEVNGHVLQAGELRVTLRTATAPGEDGWLLVWPRAGAPRVLVPLDTDVETEVLRAPWSGEAPRAVGWCYGTACIGASWTDDWSQGLDSARVSAETLVALVRVLFLPVLADPHALCVARALRDIDFGAALSAAVDGQSELKLEAEGGARRLVPPSVGSDRGQWSSAARALLLRMRIATAADRDALSAYAERLYPPALHVPGAPLTVEQLDDSRRWFDHYVSVLRACGAVHPRDALVTTTPMNRPASIANRMAHEYRDLNETELYRKRTESPAKREARLALARSAESGRLLRRLSSTPQARRDSLIAAARATVPDEPVVDSHLLAALLDDAFLRLIQLTLIDDIAFPPSK